MNPKMVAQARTARLVREATTPVYSTQTREREHLSVVEMDSDFGRFWSKPMPESQVAEYIDGFSEDYGVSDIDHAAKCWCFR